MLSGCLATPPSSSSKPVVNSNIREINLMPMGSNKFNLLIRGNVFSQHSDLRQQFTQEVEGVCTYDNYEILDLKIEEITDAGYKKPVLQGSFVCK